MKKCKALFPAFLALIIAGAVMNGNVYAADKGVGQTKCPVLGGDIDKDVYIDYQGNRIYFCCSSCIGDFKKNPDKYMKVLKDQGVTLEKTPKGEKAKPSGQGSKKMDHGGKKGM